MGVIDKHNVGAVHKHNVGVVHKHFAGVVLKHNVSVVHVLNIISRLYISITWRLYISILIIEVAHKHNTYRKLTQIALYELFIKYYTVCAECTMQAANIVHGGHMPMSL